VQPGSRDECDVLDRLDCCYTAAVCKLMRIHFCDGRRFHWKC